MLKFVKTYKLNSDKSSKVNQVNLNDIKIETITNQQIETNTETNEQQQHEQQGEQLEQQQQTNTLNNNNTQLKSKKNKKKIKLIILSIIFSIIAIAILTVLLVCIFKFTGVHKSLNKQSNSLNLNNKTCNSNNDYCEQGYFQMITNTSCLCLNNNLIDKCLNNLTNSHNFNLNNNCNYLTCFLNEFNSYTCECKKGYTWSIENQTCYDIDECLTLKCDINTSTGICLNKPGSYECECKPGFKWTSKFNYCIDINECLQNESSSSSSLSTSNKLCKTKNSICINTIGSFYCDCQTGYTKNTNGICEDINECLAFNTTRCTNETQCINTDGSYKCCLNDTINCYECGYQYFRPNLMLNQTSRIIGGIEVNPYSWPWLVSIGVNYKYEDSNGNIMWYNISHICGGSLISSNYILTAAHCVYNLETRVDDLDLLIKPNRFHENIASILTVYVGIHNQEEDKKVDRRAIKVKKIIIHENFDPRMYLNDIALLKLDKKVSKSRKVDWICYGDYLNLNQIPKVNSTLYAIGFGSTNELSYELSSNYLRQVDLKLLSFKNCELVTQFMITNSKSQFCAGYLNGKKDTCAGDSGSPVMFNSNNRWYVIGIVSYGQGCAQSFKPGINTNVSFYSNWIKMKMEF